MNLLWLQSGGCGGCSMSLLCADTTDFQGHLSGAGIDLLWHPSLSLASQMTEPPTRAMVFHDTSPAWTSTPCCFSKANGVAPELTRTSVSLGPKT